MTRVCGLPLVGKGAEVRIGVIQAAGGAESARTVVGDVVTGIGNGGTGTTSGSARREDRALEVYRAAGVLDGAAAGGLVG